MTHSSRKNYKTKWLEAQSKLDGNTSHIDKFKEIETVIASAESEREREFALIRELASEAMELAAMLDSKDGKGTTSEKDILLPIDSRLHEIDAFTIIRRTRDLLKHATYRVGLLGLTTQSYQTRLADYNSLVDSLQKPVHRLGNGIMASYHIGQAPTLKEREALVHEPGKNPRLFDFDYETDEFDSDTESGNDSAVVLSTGSSTTVGKKKQKHDISIS